MFSSQNKGNIIIPLVYQDTRTVFRLIDIVLLAGETSFRSLNKKINYYVHSGKLNNPRKGIYTKVNYNPEELANCLGFKGGTALLFFYDLPRFSHAMLSPNPA